VSDPVPHDHQVAEVFRSNADSDMDATGNKRVSAVERAIVLGQTNIRADVGDQKTTPEHDGELVPLKLPHHKPGEVDPEFEDCNLKRLKERLPLVCDLERIRGQEFLCQGFEGN